MYYSEFSFLFFPVLNLNLGDVRIVACSISSHEHTQLFSNIVDTLLFEGSVFPEYLLL